MALDVAVSEHTVLRSRNEHDGGFDFCVRLDGNDPSVPLSDVCSPVVNARKVAEVSVCVSGDGGRYKRRSSSARQSCGVVKLQRCGSAC